MSAVNGAELAWSDGATSADCRSVTAWVTKVRAGSADQGPDDRALLDGDELCVRTSEGNLAGITATGVANFGNAATLWWRHLGPGLSGSHSSNTEGWPLLHRLLHG